LSCLCQSSCSCLLTTSSFSFFFFYFYAHHRHLHSFPTRRSSELAAHPLAGARTLGVEVEFNLRLAGARMRGLVDRVCEVDGRTVDRKSTRLNSSHVAISYAVFCLKKKKRLRQTHRQVAKTK